MARTYSPEAAGLATTGQVVLSDGSRIRNGVKAVIATITLAGQASGDDIVLGEVRPGDAFLGAFENPSATLGTATIALGIEGSTAKYAAAATNTAADTPKHRGKATAIGVEETARKKILATVGTAALPGAGTLSLVLLFATKNG